MKNYWPPSNHGSILLTSQHADLSHQTKSDIKLESFTEDEGAELLLDIVDPEKKERTAPQLEIARAISNEVGGLPILLSHVGGFADRSKYPLRDLLASLQKPSHFKKIWAWDSTTSTNFQYGEPMSKVWRLAIDALEPDARTTLKVLSMLNPDGVAESMLHGDWADGNLSFLLESRQFE